MTPSELTPSAEAPGLRRLPPISVLFNVVGALKGIVLPLIVVMFASGGLSAELWLLILIVPAMLSAVLRYATFSYRLDDDELVIRKGILTRNERHVPYARIQNIDLVQNPVHRALDVAVVRLETASGGKPEAVISVLELPAVDEMRARVFADRSHRPTAVGASDPSPVDAADAGPTVTPADDPAHELVHVPTKDLVILGLISNRGMLVVAAFLGFLSQTGSFERWIDGGVTWVQQNFDWLVDRFGWATGAGTWSLSRIALVALAVVVLFIAFTRVLSIAWTLWTLHGFRLARSGSDLRTTYGLLTRITATIPRRRIQLLSARLSMIHRWTRRVSLKVETAGGGAPGGDDGGRQAPGAARLWLAPMVPRERLPALLAEVVPSLRLDAVRWHPLAARARGRIVRRRLLPLSVVTLVVYGPLVLAGSALWSLSIGDAAPIVLGILAAFGAALLVGVWLWAGRYVERTAWALTDDAVLYRSGAFGLRVSVVPLGKIQVVQRRQTWFDRRARMAKVTVDTAGASLRSHRVSIDLLDVVDAERLADRLETEAARRTFRW